jgi:hypothetical protein
MFAATALAAMAFATPSLAGEGSPDISRPSGWNTPVYPYASESDGYVVTERAYPGTAYGSVYEDDTTGYTTRRVIRDRSMDEDDFVD